MRYPGKILLTLLLLLPFILLSCNKGTTGIIVVTRQAGTYSDTLSPDKDFSSSKIGLFNVEKPGRGLKVLTGDFYSACSPDISFDGKHMLFAGRRTRESSLQIWEMNLGNGKFTELTPVTENCTDPAYLPGNRLVYSRVMVNDSLKSHLSLFTCGSDGSGHERITFTPSSYRFSTVLADGHILAICEKVYPVQGKPEMIVLRPDGTKAELFFKTPGLSGSKPFETASKIVFTEASMGKNIVSRISYNRPLHTKTFITKNTEGEYAGGIPYNDKWLVCYRNKPGQNFSLFEYDLRGGPGKQLYSETGSDVISAVPTGSRPVPKNLPSEVDRLVKTGLLLTQNISFSGTSVRTGKVKLIEITGIGASYGKTAPEADGSVYLRILADMPFRISTLDENGHVINTCNWMSLRPNERRGCTGCHEDPETVPANQLPLAVRKAPIIIPIHIEKISEKTVELE